ncbi:MAG TPA: MOSC domain-containing protein [Candidatus Limnocylindrales bacterium]|nr:MOSC domain-containing protein [Candidatus Limnocylindrales bacterium]
MDGRVLQVNVSPGGVPKLPVDEAWVGPLGLAGDRHHHDWVHGGPHRAVCLFGIEAIERVRADGHGGVVAGAVGENLTTEGIELARLPVGTRLAIGDEVVLELSSPANPCEVIKGAFDGGKSGRISVFLHPEDSRMYARVLAGGVVRPGDPIRVLPSLDDSTAVAHRDLDALEAVEREAWLAMWRAAADSGVDVRILDRGDVTAAASPELGDTDFNRAFGLRLVPIHRPEVEALFRAAGVPGWLALGFDDPAVVPGQLSDPVGVHVGLAEAVVANAADRKTPAGLRVRAVDPDDSVDVRRWAELFVRAFEIDGPLADAWPRLNPRLVRTRGYRQVIASIDGRDVGVAALLTRRRIGWLGGAGVVPEARGAGLQRAMILDRAGRAIQSGGVRLLATADLGGASAANLEALGLGRIWTRGLLRVEPAEPRPLAATMPP